MATVAIQQGEHTLELTTIRGELYTLRYLPKVNTSEKRMTISEAIQNDTTDGIPIESTRESLKHLATDITAEKGNQLAKYNVH